MAVAKQRPSLKQSSLELGGVSVLDDLDSFLDAEEDYVSQRSLTVHNLGEACAECRASSSPLMSAVTGGHKTCLNEILTAQSELDLKAVLDENEATLAHLAAKKGDVECLKAILEVHPALSEIGDLRGTTPLHVCAYHGHLECVKYLLDEGKSKVLKDKDGATAVHFAAASGHTDCLKVLIEEGREDPNDQTNSGETPGM